MNKYLTEDIQELVSRDNFLYVFDRLGDRSRQIVDLAMTGYKTKDIAKTLNISLRRVEQLLSGAIKKFRHGECLPYYED